jgi:hypothetical protein
MERLPNESWIVDEVTLLRLVFDTAALRPNGARHSCRINVTPPAVRKNHMTSQEHFTVMRAKAPRSEPNGARLCLRDQPQQGQ